LRRVHRLRAAADAILVGVGTVLKDDPKLTVKSEYAKGRNPLRVVLDSDGKIPDSAHVLDGSAPTLIVTSEESGRSFPRAEVMRLGKDEVALRALFDRLVARDVKKILVEGGRTVIWSFLRKGLADEVIVFVGRRVVGVIVFTSGDFRALHRTVHGQRKGWNRWLSVGTAGLRSVVVARSPIGAPAAIVTMEEMAALGCRTFLTFGACGSLVPDLVIGDL